MSLTRSTMLELCDFVQHKPSTILGNKFFDSRIVIPVEVAHKSDRFESRIFVISKFRVFILAGKTTGSLKIEKSFHVLSIKSIHVVKEDEISILVDDVMHKKKTVVKSATHSAHHIAKQILSAIKHYFPDFDHQLTSSVDLVPNTMYSEFSALPIATPRPCHSFRRTYAALCDFYDQPYREEVSWDVEKIYTANKVRDLRVDDFSHLLPRDLLPIVGVLIFSAYFTGLICDGIRVPSDVIDVILTVIRKSHCLKKLQLRQCALPKDFITLLASALHGNQHTTLEHLDLSKNALDDKKGFMTLSSVLPRLQQLRVVNFCECQLSEKSINALCMGLYNGMTSCKSGGMQLTELNLSSNLIKDDISSIVNLLSICTSLRVLDLSDTGIALDKLWNPLKYGGMQIEKLLLAGCSIGKKSECLQTAKEYFSMAVNLSHVSFNNTSMPSDYLKAILLGLASNQQLQPFRLDLDATCEKGSASVLDACIGGVRCETLSLRDNNLEAEMQGVLQSLMLIRCLKRLDIGGANMNQLKRSNKQAHAINKILLEVVKLYSDEGCLEELILSDCRLGAYLSVLLNTLGATTTLKSLDISANDIGSFGARILSKALQVNVSLRFLSIDNNHIAADGFVDLAASMRMNHTLTHIPYPVHDVFDCMQRAERPRAVGALAQMQNYLYRNRTSASVDEANCKKLISSGLMQQMEKSPSDVVGRVTDSLISYGSDAFPGRLNEMIEDFVEQFRREAAMSIVESLNRCMDADVSAVSSKRAEQIAVARLAEMWTEQAKHVFSEWKWQEMCEHVESEIARGANGGSADTSSVGRSSSVGTGSPAMSSPFTPKRNQAGHRPRSIIADLSTSSTTETLGGGIEVGVNLDAPPKPSSLSHLQKARPRKRGAVSVIKTNDEAMMTSRSSAGGIEEGFEDICDDMNELKVVDSKTTRIAMIPDTSLLAQVQLRPASIERNAEAASSSPMADSPPPPLPQRNRVGPGGAPPPILPPKPEPRTRFGGGLGSPLTPTGNAEDDENANSRRSPRSLSTSSSHPKTEIVLLHIGQPWTEFYAKEFLHNRAAIFYNIPDGLRRFIPKNAMTNARIRGCIRDYGKSLSLEDQVDELAENLETALTRIIPEFGPFRVSRLFHFDKEPLEVRFEQLKKRRAEKFVFVPLYSHYSSSESGHLLSQIGGHIQATTVPLTVGNKEVVRSRIEQKSDCSFDVSAIHRWNDHPFVSEYWARKLRRIVGDLDGIVFAVPRKFAYNRVEFDRSVWATCERVMSQLDNSVPWRMAYFNAWDAWRIPCRDALAAHVKSLATLSMTRKIAVVPVTEILETFDTLHVLPSLENELNVVVLKPDDCSDLVAQGMSEIVKNHLLGRENRQLDTHGKIYDQITIMVSSGEDRTNAAKPAMDDDGASDSEGDAAEDILEESPDKRWSKRREQVKQRDVPGIDVAYLAMDNETGNEVVWNEVQFSERKNFRAQEEKINAVFDNLTQLVHTNLVKFHKYWTDSKSEKPRIIFITEYMSSGSMSAFLQRTRKAGSPLSIKAWKKWTTQILSALNYLHSSDPPIIHGNLTCNTVFIQQNGLIKIGCVAPDAINHHVKTCRENMRYMHYIAPEYENGSEVTPAADIYSFGICSLEIAVIGGLSGCQNGSAEGPVTEDVIEKAIRSLDDPLQQDFIRQCLRRDPVERPTARQLLFHQILFEVHSLKLLAAHAIVDSKKYDDVSESVFRIPDNEKIAATSKFKEMAYCQVAAFQLDLEKFLDDVRNGIYPLTAFAPLAHQPSTTLKAYTNQNNATSDSGACQPTNSASGESGSKKDSTHSQNGCFDATPKAADNDDRMHGSAGTSSGGGGGGGGGHHSNNHSSDAYQNGTTSHEAPSTPPPADEQGDVRSESRHILEINVHIEDDEVSIVLLLEDQMHRQLTTTLTKADTPESLTSNLVAHGFVCQLDSNGVEEAISEAFSIRAKKLEGQLEEDSDDATRPMVNGGGGGGVTPSRHQEAV
ncbi:unnamed protein product [Caenorhabditis bovis]|uniref:Protein kinase domain-containing protein n=1 Tax=Caenorhabditis bovis TaxID=2654633 RepID=A0A8S1F5I0_9PELO|nr:unnamed protein product [Caenorhabditis bovis]